MTRSSSLATLALSSALLACGPSRPADAGPLMNPGQDCLGCHVLGGEAQDEVFTAAGTVFESPTAAVTAGISGVTVILTDAAQKQTRLTTNEVGNFYTSVLLKAPFTVTLERNGKQVAMGATPTGNCASCHTSPPKNNAPGRIYIAP